MEIQVICCVTQSIGWRRVPFASENLV